MKLTKKIASILLALAMILALATTAMAYTIDTEHSHTYEVYQIFTGELSGETLSNLNWGLNGTGTKGEKVDSAIAEEITSAGNSDTDRLAVIKKYVNLAGDPYGTVTADQALTDVPAGYYLIKDVDGSFENQYDSYTLYSVKIVGDETIVPKSGVPSVQKKVDDHNDSNTTEDGLNWQDSADYDIGDEVPFQITATLPGNYTDYDKYTLTFTDTMAKGLTYDAATSNLTIMFGTTNITSYFTPTVTADGDNTILTLTCDDLTKIEGLTNNSQIILTYNATLNENANLNFVGNTNTVYMQFSNDPNWIADADGNPDTPNPDDYPDEPKGQTPEDTVIVFTYKTVINKVDSNNKALKGAAFKLEKQLADGSWELVKEYTAGETTTFEFVGLDDGVYKLTETVTPAGYNSIEPITFTITATHSIENAEPVLETLTGEPAVNGTISFSMDPTDSSLTANVVNNQGSILPETGGIGTTIFYIVGGILVVGAIVLLVTRKRMSR